MSADELLAVGGDWELVFGGFLRFYVPEGCDFVLRPRWGALWEEGEEPLYTIQHRFLGLFPREAHPACRRGQPDPVLKERG